MKKILLLCCLCIGLITVASAQSASTSADPVIKAKGLQKQLGLTDGQTSKVADIYSQSARQFDKIKSQDHGNTDKMVVDIGPLRNSTVKRIKNVLTVSQATKYEHLLRESKSNTGINSGWAGGWSTENGS